MKLTKQLVVFFFILIIISTLVKVICAPQINLSGFTAIIAVALFAGLTVKDKKFTFLLPLLTLFISDVLLQLLHSVNVFPFPGFYSGQITNYALILLVTVIGFGLKNLKTTGIIAAVFIGPVVFFLLSNFLVWKTSGTQMGYANNFSGLMQCYTFGLLFFRNSLISTIIFLPSFIALYNRMMYGKLQLSKV